jgi:hypothetical protein
MRHIEVLIGIVLMTSLLAAPAQAQLLKLGGSGGGTSVSVPGVATVNLGTGSSGTTAGGTVLGGGGSTLNADLSGVLGGNSGVNLTLPGTGSSTADGLVTDVASTTNGLTGSNGTVDMLLSSLLGGGLLGGGTGGNPGGNGGNGGAGGVGGPGSGFGGGFSRDGISAVCLSDATGIARLLRMQYSASMLAQWRRAAGVHVVKVPVCPQIRSNLARTVALNGSIQMMQGAAAADPLVSASLDRVHLGAHRVLGVGQANGDLTVYVY